MARDWTCPYCNRDATITTANITHGGWKFDDNNKEDSSLTVYGTAITCPNKQCREYTLEIELIKMLPGGNYGPAINKWKLRPQSSAKPFPDYVPTGIIEDYEEACLTRDLSPKASATLSRRCLQGMIRNFWGISKDTLNLEIKALQGEVDQGVWEAIDAVRKVGNIGAHMEKDINLIIDVEPDEAQILIDLIEMLLKEWYVARHQREQRLSAIVELAKQKTEQKTERKAEGKPDNPL